MGSDVTKTSVSPPPDGPSLVVDVDEAVWRHGPLLVAAPYDVVEELYVGGDVAKHCDAVALHCDVTVPGGNQLAQVVQQLHHRSDVVLRVFGDVTDGFGENADVTGIHCI